MKLEDRTGQLVFKIFLAKKKGFGYIWLCQGVGFEASFIAEFKDKLISCYKQNWQSEIESDDRYRWFHSFKCTFEPEKKNICCLLLTNG